MFGNIDYAFWGGAYIDCFWFDEFGDCLHGFRREGKG